MVTTTSHAEPAAEAEPAVEPGALAVAQPAALDVTEPASAEPASAEPSNR